MSNSERDEWLARRKLGIGGSDAAACAGLDSWRTRLDVYLEKTGQAKELRDSSALYWARRLEPIVIAEYEHRTGLTVVDRQREVVHPDVDWQRCTLDGMTGEIVIEAKTWHTVDDNWGDDGTDQIPIKYVAQALHNMRVCQTDTAHVPVLFLADKAFRIYVVKYDAVLDEQLASREAEVWDAVRSNNPPEPITLADVNKLWREDDGGEAVASPTLIESIGRLEHVKHVQKELQQTREQLELELKKFMGPAAVLLDDEGRELATWKHNKTRRVNVTRLRDERPDVADEFTDENTVRTLRVKKVKTND